MNSRDQFLRTINHREPNRVVIDLGSTAVTGIHIHALSRLRRHYGLQRKPIRVLEPFNMLGEVSWELIDAVGIDVIGTWPLKNKFGYNNYSPYKEWKTPWGQRVMVPSNFNITYDENGDVMMHPEGDTSIPPSAKMNKSGYSFEIIDRQQAVAEEETDVEDNMEEFGLLSDKDLEHWRVEVDKAYFSGKAVIASFDGTALGDQTMISGVQLRQPKGIRNISHWYSDLVSRPEHIKKIFDRQTEVAIENLRRLYSVTGNKINAIFMCGTDLGPQGSSFSSLDQFEDLWLPGYRKMNDWIHQNTQWKTFKHSQSMTESLIDGFIRAGFDIINPVQADNAGLDSVKLKERYGHNLVFWGGGMGSPNILPEASPAEIRELVLRNCEVFNKNGGFVFSPGYNIPAKVPVENIVAMLEALQEFNGRP